MGNPNPRNQFKPGVSGNPNGRPKAEWTWTGELKKALEESAKDGRPIKEIVAKSLIAEAIKGNVQASKAIMERMEGLPKQNVQMDATVNVLFDESLRQDEN